VLEGKPGDTLDKTGKSGMIPRFLEWRIFEPDAAQSVHPINEEET
jgi:hypothetical protein